MYFKKSYIKFFYFYQQCKNYFKIAKATKINYILFTAFFYIIKLAINRLSSKLISKRYFYYMI